MNSTNNKEPSISEDEHVNKLPYGIIEKQPNMELEAYYYADYDKYKEEIPVQMENAMFYAYYDDHTREVYEENIKAEKRILTGEKLKNMFPCWGSVYEREEYTYECYAGIAFPKLKEREATFAMIFTDRQHVAFSVDNTYKYQEWDELFEEMTKDDDEICNRRGLHLAFVIFTDTLDTIPIWTLYEKTVAGFIVDHQQKKLTAFGPESAILIFHALYQLCSAQYGRGFGVTSRTCTKHLHDDSVKASCGDIYVKEFRRRIKKYQDNFDITDMITQISN